MLYTLEQLREENDYTIRPRITAAHLTEINGYIEKIEQTRTEQPQPFDDVDFTNEYGQRTEHATIERAREELKQAISEELAEGTHFGDMYAERREDLTINEDENSWEVYENDWGYSNYASYHISTQEVVE